jgi:hypothetical protein
MKVIETIEEQSSREVAKVVCATARPPLQRKSNITKSRPQFFPFKNHSLPKFCLDSHSPLSARTLIFLSFSTFYVGRV